MLAFALRDDGWYLRSDIIWSKGNPMPESVQDRPTKSHEYIFLLSKSPKYRYDVDAIREPHVRNWDETNGRGIYAGKNCMSQKQNDQIVLPHPNGRNSRSVWNINTEPSGYAHYACFPSELARRCIKAGSYYDDVVLDPFVGTGTTCKIARGLMRKSIGIDLNPDYINICRQRLGIK